MPIRSAQRTFAPLVRPAPGEEFYAIGDVHGRADLLACLLELVPDGAQVVFTGDLIDRGPRSLECVDLAMDVRGAIACMGNHEQMLLIALQDDGPRSRVGWKAWLANGGDAFAAQLVGDVAPTPGAVAAALGADRLAWLRGMATCHRRGDVLFVHAGLSPTIPMDAFLAQPWDVDLLSIEGDEHWAWIREPFLKSAGHRGVFVVHGHDPYDGLARGGFDTIAHDRVNLDLGSYHTGRARLARLSRDLLIVWDAQGEPA